jgi:hypothetical protein
MYGKQTNEKFEQFVDMYNSCDVLLLSNQLQKAQQHQHTCTCRKKNHVYRFHYLLPPMCERKILEHLELNKNNQFSKRTYIHKQKKIQSLKDLKENEDMLFKFFWIL